MNRCAQFARQIDDTVAGRCGPGTARWMAEHAEVCAGCRRAEAEAREMRTTVRAAIEQVRAEAPLSEEAFLASLHARIAPPAAGRTAGRQLLRRAALGSLPAPLRGRVAVSAAGAAVLLVATLGLLLPRWQGSRSTSPSAARIAQGLRPGGRPAVATDAGDRLSRSAPRVATSPTAPLVQGRGGSTIARAAGLPSKAGQATVPAPTVGPGPRARRLLAVEDLAYLNGDPLAKTRRWTALSADKWDTVESPVRRGVAVRDDFVRVPFPRLADLSGRQIAAAVASYKREAAAVDTRLAREVTLQQKGTALSTLCERLRGDTGIPLSAGQSVADEKVTLFCKQMPLREVMRQLSRPFGYTWLRSGKEGEYRYELVQDLRSQLLEEELRNRDRNAALLALEREIEQFRPYLGLTPDEALARAQTASPAEKALLEKLSSWGWGPIQMYFRLSRRDLEALRSGQRLHFSAAPSPGERPLPPDVARGVFQAFREWRCVTVPDGYEFAPIEIVGPNGVPITAIPEARARVGVTLEQSELGQFTLGGGSGVFSTGDRAKNISSRNGQPPYAIGRSPAAFKPQNGAANAALSRDPALRARATVQPQPLCGVDLSPSPSPNRGGAPFPLPDSGRGSGGEVPPPKLTSAEALEALHRATGMPIVADYYTRLYKPSEVSVRQQPLFDALNHVADAMRLRWDREGGWLQFRSATFYDDRLKEVPNRLLARWTAARQQHGMLTLDHLVEIAQLSDAQLDAAEMAEGARLCWGLTEWDLARNAGARAHLRYLAGFTPDQRQEALSPAGLRFTRMPLAQQQQFIGFALSDEPLQSLEELSEATLRVDYTQPGWFQWGDPGLFHNWSRWVIPIEPGRQGRRVVRPPLRAKTREEVLQALLRLDPRVRQTAVHTPVPSSSALDPAERVPPLEAQIFPTALSLTFVYIPSSLNARRIRISHDGMTNYQLSW